MYNFQKEFVTDLYKQSFYYGIINIKYNQLIIINIFKRFNRLIKIIIKIFVFYVVKNKIRVKNAWTLLQDIFDPLFQQIV